MTIELINFLAIYINMENKKELTCTRCKGVKTYYCEIVYSQGDKVCLDCKKETLESDKRAFDRDMRFNHTQAVRV